MRNYLIEKMACQVFLKRGFDIVFSVVGLVPATPIILVTSFWQS